ncbi:Dual specificity protein kinase clk3 [Scheffersomyces spartinae]|uniref:Dual specificity protein kinase clk3 n=1 Tax=Scheffersomyces spartinae TaxID=45513 RepID=A0A9P7VAQ8_9ASCO|nr:Dual specificity protein kinase clk3 [Scheffersomyces spartinae]KAG7194457.1 Dual specificity protein kinase clk3 [Scheffersomyces spartinae]
MSSMISNRKRPRRFSDSFESGPKGSNSGKGTTANSNGTNVVGGGPGGADTTSTAAAVAAATAAAAAAAAGVVPVGQQQQSQSSMVVDPSDSQSVADTTGSNTGLLRASKRTSTVGASRSEIGESTEGPTSSAGRVYLIDEEDDDEIEETNLLYGKTNLQSSLTPRKSYLGNGSKPLMRRSGIVSRNRNIGYGYEDEMENDVDYDNDGEEEEEEEEEEEDDMIFYDESVKPPMPRKPNSAFLLGGVRLGKRRSQSFRMSSSANARDRDRPKASKRNNSDPMIYFGTDAIAAYNLFNVNNDTVHGGETVGPLDTSSMSSVSSSGINGFSFSNGRHHPVSNSILAGSSATSSLQTSPVAMMPRKQRTNSLPQLPQVKCFYHKIPDNYILQHPKVGDVKTEVIGPVHDHQPCDDDDGHYIIKVNEMFANRFVILKLLGQGTFGKVIDCYDELNKQRVAVKIIRNIPKYRDAAKIELRILLTIKKFDNENLNHCIHLRECFDFRGHICIVTDLMKISLFDFLEKNKYIAFPGSHIQAIAKQLIRSVTFLHDLNLIHTDLKPENILLYDDSYVRKRLYSSTIINSFIRQASSMSNKTLIGNGNDSGAGTRARKVPKTSKVLNNPSILIIDFGLAIFNDEYHAAIVLTRHYRAPEIVLGTGWSFSCDMWSVGCIMVELIIGEALFRTHDNLEHLAMIERVCGYPIDRTMVRTLKQNENECGLMYFTDEVRGVGRMSDDEYDEDDDVLNDSSEDDNILDSQRDDDDDLVDDETDDILDDDDEEADDDDDDGDDDDDDDDIIIDQKKTRENSLKLIFPSSRTPKEFVTNVNLLKRIDLFISERIGLHIDFDYSLSHNYDVNKDKIEFGNFVFWWFLLDLLRKLLVINPNERITAQEAMNHPWFNLGIVDEGTT